MAGSRFQGPFEIIEMVGEGGMGRVYRGRHRQTGVDVAVKLISREADEWSHRLFRREVQAHAGLIHPNIVYLFEYGTIAADCAQSSDGELVEGTPFVAMEFAGQGSLCDQGAPQSWGAVADIAMQVLDGLAFSHARGVIHRDLKPENLLVFPDPRSGQQLQIKLADFGIAAD